MLRLVEMSFLNLSIVSSMRWLILLLLVGGLVTLMRTPLLLRRLKMLNVVMLGHAATCWCSLLVYVVRRLNGMETLSPRVVIFVLDVVVENVLDRSL